MREAFHNIVSGWTIISGMGDITERIEQAAEWTKQNGPLEPDEEATINLMIEAQIARGGFSGEESGDDEYEPMVMGDESEGECPACGHRLQYREVIPEADVGVNYCPECGYEGGVG